MPSDFVKVGYNKAAEDYAAKRDQFNNLKYLEKLDALLRPQSSILDIGCGAGKPVDSYLISKGHYVTGLDISDKMIELAKRNVPSGQFKVEDMSELKPGEYQIDAVVSFYAIFHTSRETHQELFKKINSFLPVGGLLLITMGSSDWEGREQNFHGTEMFWSHFNHKKNRQLVESAGFTILLDEIDETGSERHQIILGKKIAPVAR
ncbi:MAG TPA: class I SAM-dependent methyltransferase [Ktedonobacterales bacterium]|nr:class I SAM-dependent methyltransferase [Ktedonobacterales bacterium]